MKKKLTESQTEIYKSYHISGMANYIRPKVNSFSIHTNNSLPHELKKLEICYELKKTKIPYITEVVDNKTNLRRDIVALNGAIYEIETTMSRAKRFLGQENVIIIPVGWSKEDPKWQKAKSEVVDKQ